jgi:hypothetical protein
MICLCSITGDSNPVPNLGFTFPAHLRIAVFEVLSELRVVFFILEVVRIV